MADTHETSADIIAEARDKYTVHECNQCAWRKCCSRGFGSEECGKFRESIFLHLGIEDGYFTQLLDRLDAAHRRELSKNASKNGADFGQLGDSAKLREALCEILSYIESFHKYIIPGKREKTTALFAVADTIRGKARAALAAPPRNCDVGTAEEQSERFAKFCHANINTQRCCGDCPAFRTTRDDCELVWAQMSYVEKEGGAK